MRNIDLALIKAVVERDAIGTEQLLRAGADPNTEEGGEQGLTVLMLSINASKSDVARLLLEYGAIPNKRAEGQWTPLIEASYQGYSEIVRLLLQHGADPHIEDLNGGTALSQSNDESVCALLRSYGAV